MDSDGTHEARGTRANQVPRPAGPSGDPAVPPVPPLPPGPPRSGEDPAGDPASAAPPPPPAVPPGGRSATAEWLDRPRPAAEPGIWRLGYRRPRPASTGERLSPVTLVGVAVPLVVGLLLWSLWRNGSIPYQWALLRLVTPDDWWWGRHPRLTQGHGGRRGPGRLRRRLLRRPRPQHGPARQLGRRRPAHRHPAPPSPPAPSSR
ncbi:hypothetical protein GCM10020256_19410 [Streptomyces thermocoprophilus]